MKIRLAKHVKQHYCVRHADEEKYEWWWTWYWPKHQHKKRRIK